MSVSLRIGAFKGAGRAHCVRLVRASHRAAGPASAFHRLAHWVGNTGMTRWMDQLRLQPKLAVNAPGDVYEREADRVANQVMRMRDPEAAPAIGTAAPLVQRCACGGTCPSCQESED